MKKLVEIYLAAISALYILLGLIVIIPPMRPLVILGFFGMIVGAVPFVAASWMNLCFQSIFAPQSQCPPNPTFGPGLIGLGVAAIIIGIFALISLNKIDRNPRWLYFWYLVSGLSVIIFLMNSWGHEFPYLQIIHPLLICLSTWALAKKRSIQIA